MFLYSLLTWTCTACNYVFNSSVVRRFFQVRSNSPSPNRFLHSIFITKGMNRNLSPSTAIQQTSSSNLRLRGHLSEELTGLSIVPRMARTFSLGEARNHWSYIDGEERIQVNGAIYVIHDAFRHGYNKITFILSPASSVTGSDISQIFGSSSSTRAGRNAQGRLLQRFRSRVRWLFRRTRP